MATTHETHQERHTDPVVEGVAVGSTTWTNRVRRVSWGAILGGLFTAVSCQLLLSLLGLAIGFWSIEPTTEANPVSGIGVGAGIWWVLTGLISLVLGGWVAGRMAGIPNPVDGMLHGLVCWGLLTVLSFYFVGSALGSVLNATVSTLGQAVSVAIPDAEVGRRSRPAGQEERISARININYNAIGNELSQMMRKGLRDTNKEELSPQQLEQDAQKLVTIAKDAATTAAKRPDSAEQQLERVLDAFYTRYHDVKKAADEEAVVNVITANSKMSKEEAQRVVNRWQNEYAQAKKQLQEKLDTTAKEAKQQAKETWQATKEETAEVADEVSDAIASASIWAFIVMLVGVGSAMLGGAMGAPGGLIRKREHPTSS